MITKADIVAKAKSLVHVPYHHQGRSRAGLDCAGLIILIAQELGLSSFDITGYDRHANGVEFLQCFDENCHETIVYERGDILVLKVSDVPQHCGIFNYENGVSTLIHAHYFRNFPEISRVVETSLKEWEGRIIKAYQFPNLENGF